MYCCAQLRMKLDVSLTGIAGSVLFGILVADNLEYLFEFLVKFSGKLQFVCLFRILSKRLFCIVCIYDSVS